MGRERLFQGKVVSCKPYPILALPLLAPAVKEDSLQFTCQAKFFLYLVPAVIAMSVPPTAVGAKWKITRSLSSKPVIRYVVWSK